MGDLMAVDMNSQLPLVADPILNAYVSSLGNAIAGVSDRPDLEYRFYVINSPVVNAFALPGGHIYLSRGLIEQTASGSELAAALAHEIGHVAERHGVAKMERHLRTGSVVSMLYNVILGGEPEILRQDALEIGGALGRLADLGERHQQFGTKHAQHLVGCGSRIGQRTENVEQRLDAELLAHDIGALDEGGHLVQRVAAAHALAAHAAVGGDDEPLGRNVLHRTADVLGHVFLALDLQRVMVDDADRDLHVRDALADRLEIHAVGAHRLERDDVRVHFVQDVERGLVGLKLGEHALLRGVAPARVAPHLGLVAQAAHRVVEHLEHELGVDDLVDDAVVLGLGRGEPAVALGVGLDLFVGAYAGFCVEEFVDFVGGIFLVDFKDDDIR